MSDDLKAYELLRSRRYPSTAFYDHPRPNYRLTIGLAIVFIIVIILIFIVIMLLWRNRRKACTTVPAAPSDVSAGAISNTQFIVQWKPISAADTYRVYVGQSTGFLRSRAVNITTTKNTRATITGLTLNRTYYIIVTANNQCGESDGSAEITFQYLSL
jgi:hypothetical protein